MNTDSGGNSRVVSVGSWVFGNALLAELRVHLKLGWVSLIAIEIHFHSCTKRFTPIRLLFLRFLLALVAAQTSMGGWLAQNETTSKRWKTGVKVGPVSCFATESFSSSPFWSNWAARAVLSPHQNPSETNGVALIRACPCLTTFFSKVLLLFNRIQRGSGDSQSHLWWLSEKLFLVGRCIFNQRAWFTVLGCLLLMSYMIPQLGVEWGEGGRVDIKQSSI